LEISPAADGAGAVPENGEYCTYKEIVKCGITAGIFWPPAYGRQGLRSFVARRDGLRVDLPSACVHVSRIFGDCVVVVERKGFLAAIMVEGRSLAASQSAARDPFILLFWDYVHEGIHPP